MNRRLLSTACAWLAWGAISLWTSDSQSAVMVSPTVVLDTDLGESGPGGEVENMINQSGLDKPYTSGVTDFDDYFTTGAPPFAQAPAGNNWQSALSSTVPVTGYVDFDFGAVYAIDRVAIWNISLKDIRILVSETSVATLQDVAGFTLPNHINFPASYSHDLLDLGAAHNARYVRVQIDSVHLFSPSDTFGYAIVGELVASVVPTVAGLDGDYNSNGTVDAADYAVWRDNLDSNFSMPNDTTPGSVGNEDYELWKSQFGASGSGLAASTIIPEPAGWLLALVLLFGRSALRTCFEILD